MIKIDRIKRHARGTKPLRGICVRKAQNKLAHTARIRQWKDDRFTVRGVILGFEPWPVSVDRPDWAHPNGGAR